MDSHPATHVSQVARAPGDVQHSGRSPLRFLQSETSVSDVTPPRKEADIVYQRVVSMLLGGVLHRLGKHQGPDLM